MDLMKNELHQQREDDETDWRADAQRHHAALSQVACSRNSANYSAAWLYFLKEGWISN